MDGGGGTTFDELMEEAGKVLEELFLKIRFLKLCLIPRPMEAEESRSMTIEIVPAGEPPPRFEVEFPTDGGGGMTLVARDVPDPPGVAGGSGGTAKMKRWAAVGRHLVCRKVCR